MADFSIRESVFAGWGLIRRKPGLFLALAIYCFVINIAGYWVIMSLVGEPLAMMAELRRTGELGAMADPSTAMQVAGSGLVLQLVYSVMLLLSFMVAAGAVARAVIRPSTSKPPYIGLGADEFRLMVVGLVVGLILFAVSFAGSIVATLAGLGTAFATGEIRQMAENPGELPLAMAIVTYSLMGLVTFLTFLFSIRFSLAPAQSEREEGVRIFGSFALTKSRFWRMTGTYLLALLTLLPFALIQVGILVTLAMNGGLEFRDAMMTTFQPDWSQQSIWSPTVLTFVVLNSINWALGAVICLGSSFNIYAQIEGTAEPVDDDDDDDDDDD